MLIKKVLFLLLKSYLLTILFIFVFAANTVASSSLKKLFPSVSVLNEIKSVGDSQEAKGNELFELINGGAVLFFKYDFKQAVFQEYTLKDGKTVQVEIYQMASSKGAEGIYLEKKGEGGEKLNLGRDGVLLDYYCMLWQGPYYISISGNDSTEDVRKNITAIARIIVDNIKKVDDRPF